MNDSTLTQLKVLVERAVRPVRAPLRRKMKMREELLAHVSAVFEEESAKLDTPDDALTRTRRRFGDPAELTASLQGAVPALERVVGGLQCYLGQRPGESAWQFAFRHAWLAGLYATGAACLGFLLTLLIMVLLHNQGLRQDWLALAWLAALGLGMFLLGSVAVLIGHGLLNAVRESGRRFWMRTSLLLIGSACVGPALLIAISLQATNDLAAALTEARPALPLAALLPPFVYVSLVDLVRRFTAAGAGSSWLYTIAFDGCLALILGTLMFGVSMLVTANADTSLEHARVIACMVLTWLLPFDLLLSAPSVAARLRADREWSRLPIDPPAGALT